MRRFKTMHIINLIFLYVNFFFMVFFILNLIECFVFYFSGGRYAEHKKSHAQIRQQGL